MKLLLVRPEGWPCTLLECPPGFFTFHDHLCFKTEYMPDNVVEVYCSSGEAFWGGAKNKKEREALIVQPVEPNWQELENI